MVLRSTVAVLTFLVIAGWSACVSQQVLKGEPDGPEPGDEVVNSCVRRLPEGAELDGSRADWTREHYIRWLPDGSRILFNGPPPAVWGPVALYSVDPDGLLLQKVVAVPDTFDLLGWGSSDSSRGLTRQSVDVPERDPVWGIGSSMMYFDISPDSSRVTYSTCAYTEVVKREVKSDWWDDYRQIIESEIDETTDAKQKEGSKRWIYNYEIVVSDLDGTDAKRLTENIHFNNFPTWSPEGSKIAFMTDTNPYFHSVFRSRGDRITIYETATGRSKEVVLPPDIETYPHRLTWSPDGERIAFVAHTAYRAAPSSKKMSVYTIGSDGSGLTRITDAASGPAWSPDGQRIAVVVPMGEGKNDSGSGKGLRRHVDVALYTFAADGSDPVLVGENLPDPWYFPVVPWMGDLSWSPNGSEILLNGFAYRVPLDGSPPVDHGASSTGIIDASWSPSGSRIAIRVSKFSSWNGKEGVVFIIDQDGANIRALVEVGKPIRDNRLRLAQ